MKCRTGQVTRFIMGGCLAVRDTGTLTALATFIPGPRLLAAPAPISPHSQSMKPNNRPGILPSTLPCTSFLVNTINGFCDKQRALRGLQCDSSPKAEKILRSHPQDGIRLSADSQLTSRIGNNNTYPPAAPETYGTLQRNTLSRCFASRWNQSLNDSTPKSIRHRLASVAEWAAAVSHMHDACQNAPTIYQKYPCYLRNHTAATCFFNLSVGRRCLRYKEV